MAAKSSSDRKPELPSYISHVLRFRFAKDGTWNSGAFETDLRRFGNCPVGREAGNKPIYSRP